jgi:hypothetical protein
MICTARQKLELAMRLAEAEAEVEWRHTARGLFWNPAP